MRNSLSFFTVVILLLAGACNSEDKKTADVPAKDSAVATEPAPLDTSAFSVPVDTTKTEAPVAFSFNLPKGTAYSYTMTLDATNQSEGRKMGTGMNWNYNLNVVDDKNKVKTVKVTYKRIDMSMDMGMGGQKLEFSSEKKVEESDFMQMPSRMFGVIKGKSFTMKVNDRGEIIAVEGFDKIGEAIVAEMKVPDAQKTMMLQNFKQQFNDKAAKEMFSQAFEIFPGKPVKVGDSWKKTSTPIGGDDMSSVTTYTVRNIAGGKVYLDVNSKIDTGDEGSAGSQTGKMVVDAATGLVQDASLTNKITGAKRNITTKTRIQGKRV